MATFTIQYDPAAVLELRGLARYWQVEVVSAIEQHLLHEPTRVSRSRIKRLDPALVAEFRLRVGDFRVFYNVEVERSVVVIIAIRLKERRTLPEVGHDPRH